MSLATRCTSCATAFRVVQDQLKVSEGWVRCGRCDAVFNALEGLFDLGRDAPDWEKTLASLPIDPGAVANLRRTNSGADAFFAEGAVDASAPAGAAGSAQPLQNAADDFSGDDDGPTSDLGELLADPIDAHLFGPRKRAESAPKPAGQLGVRDRVEFSDARFDSDLFAESPSLPDTELVLLPSTDASALSLESATRPEFVRRAERRARWQSTQARFVLGLASLVAALILALQVAHHFRDSFAAEMPALRGPLVAWCRLAGCALEAPRSLEDVLLESSTLTKAAGGQDAFVLSVNLRNRSAHALRLPSIDLRLTDNNGRLVASRALSPRDFHAAEAMAPSAETSLQTTLTAGTAGTAPVVGYVVEIFYP